MALTPSQRRTREWPLLIFTLLLVGAVVFPLWRHFNSNAEFKWGARLEKPNADLQSKLRLGENEGLVVAGFDANSPAERAGVKLNDVIIKVGDKSVSNDASGFSKLAKEQNVDGPVDVTVNRDGKEQTIKGAIAQGDHWFTWPPERWAKLLIGPEQIACYCCFIWGLLIFASRYWEMRRQHKALHLGLLSTEEGTRILPEDARGLQRRIDQITAPYGPFILANMIRAGLSKLALSRSSHDVRETLKTQAEVDIGRLISSMATMNYLAWAIPAIGFFGTVRGLAGSMTLAGQGGEQLRIATQHLTIAFDCTLVALGLSLVSMFLIHVLQREEESLVIDCQQYCLEHLVNRIYEPDPSTNGVALHSAGVIVGSLSERGAR